MVRIRSGRGDRALVSDLREELQARRASACTVPPLKNDMGTLYNVNGRPVRRALGFVGGFVEERQQGEPQTSLISSERVYSEWYGLEECGKSGDNPACPPPTRSACRIPKSAS